MGKGGCDQSPSRLIQIFYFYFSSITWIERQKTLWIKQGRDLVYWKVFKLGFKHGIEQQDLTRV